MLCAISGEAPQVPVASKKTGAIYEKRLIETYISENGTEPTTGESLAIEDLIDIKAPRAVRPRPPSLTSIPSLLGVFQEEWDALALEAFTLRQNLAQTRQELSTALYQHDAAIRVIARLTKERDDARQALSKVDIGRPSTNGDVMQVDNATLSPSIIETIKTTQESLSKTRRKRPVPEDWATPDSVSSYRLKTKSDPFYTGGTALAAQSSDGGLALMGSTEGVAGIYSTSQNQLLHELQGGGGSIDDALWANDKAIFATSSGKVQIFQGSSETTSFDAHAGGATAVALHPSGVLLASVGTDRSYVLYDLQKMATVAQISSSSSFTCAKFHPDGHLLAAGGTDGQIRVFDVKSGSEAAVFNAESPLKKLFFSENGIWLAAVTQNSTSISIWDIRKSQEVNAIDTGITIESIDWDYTGQFLLAAGQGGISVHAYSKASKEWTEPFRNAASVKSVAWGSKANSILALGEDGVLNIFGA